MTSLLSSSSISDDSVICSAALDVVSAVIRIEVVDDIVVLCEEVDTSLSGNLVVNKLSWVAVDSVVLIDLSPVGMGLWTDGNREIGDSSASPLDNSLL